MTPLTSVSIDFEKGTVTATHEGKTETLPLADPRAFDYASHAWLRCGWDVKYNYSFTWMGRPIIQLPEDIVRIQELIYLTKPDVVLECGIAHGGSLIFYASLLKAMEKGRVIGVDVEIRSHNRQAVEAHEMFPLITMIEGSSIDPKTVQQVKDLIQPGEKVLLLLDSNHSKDHVLGELRAYADLVPVGSYIVSCDGIMEEVVGAPFTKPDWSWNNPKAAAEEFVKENPNFVIEEPPLQFNESLSHTRLTYFPGGYLRRIS